MAEKRKKKDKAISIEELYRNKNFVPPKEKNLETIFEEPRKSKDGVPMLTSVKKFKRYLHFDTTVGKIHKRKVRAKKCVKKMKLGNLKTRSSPKTEECLDISLYMSEVLGESSDTEMETTDREIKLTDSNLNKSGLDAPRTSMNNDSKSESLQSMPKQSAAAESQSDERNCSSKPNVDVDAPSNTVQTFSNESSNTGEDLQDGDESKDSGRSSCAIT